MNNTRDKSLEVYINSAVDTTNINDTLSNWTSYFQIPVDIQPNESYGLSVKKAAICNTIPQFHKEERTFKLNNFVVSIDGDRLFTNTVQLCDYLTSLCSSEGIALNFSVDDNTKRVKITNGSGSNLVIDLANPYLAFWKKMGFQYDLVDNLPSITITPNDDVKFRYIAKLIPTQRVFIVCDEVIPNSSYPTNNNRPIIGSIDLVGGYGSFNFSVEPYLYEHDIRYKHAFSSLSFSILDDQYRQIEMRGGSVNLSLVIKKI
jgi:hypothetical protein